MKVKITSHDGPRDWYAGLEDEIFKVVDQGPNPIVEEDFWEHGQPWRRTEKHNRKVVVDQNVG